MRNSLSRGTTCQQPSEPVRNRWGHMQSLPGGGSLTSAASCMDRELDSLCSGRLWKAGSRGLCWDQLCILRHMKGDHPTHSCGPQNHQGVVKAWWRTVGEPQPPGSQLRNLSRTCTPWSVQESASFLEQVQRLDPDLPLRGDPAPGAHRPSLGGFPQASWCVRAGTGPRRGTQGGCASGTSDSSRRAPSCSVLVSGVALLSE